MATLIQALLPGELDAREGPDATNKHTCDLSDCVIAAEGGGEGHRDHEPRLWLAPTRIHICMLKGR